MKTQTGAPSSSRGGPSPSPGVPHPGARPCPGLLPPPPTTPIGSRTQLLESKLLPTTPSCASVGLDDQNIRYMLFLLAVSSFELQACPTLMDNVCHKGIAMSSMGLCRWQDDYPDSWEAEESISPDIVALWEQKQKQQSGEAQHTSSSSNHGSSLQASSQAVSQLEPSTA